jgi:hypothetical protein
MLHAAPAETSQIRFDYKSSDIFIYREMKIRICTVSDQYKDMAKLY